MLPLRPRSLGPRRALALLGRYPRHLRLLLRPVPRPPEPHASRRRGEAEGDLEARVEAEFFAAVGQREEVAVADMEQWLIEEKREPRGANVRLETDVRKLALED